MAAYEDLWLNHRLAGRELLREDLAALYDAFETPRKVRGDLEFLRGEELREYMAAVRARALEAPVERRRAARARDPPRAPAHRDDAAGDGAGRHRAAVVRRTAPVSGTGLEMVEVAEGPFELGSGPTGFAYDNERPRHSASTERFTIGRTPVTNATWLRFAEGGGYERREWWSDEGWAWKQQYDITHHAPAEAGDPDAPVVHISWFEADAFARAHEARLPTEIEWEKAATWDQLEGVGRSLGMDREPLHGLPGFRRAPVPGVLRSVLRRPLPGAARRLVRHAPARRLPAVPQLGPPRTPAALRRSQDRAMNTALGDIEIVSRLGADERTLAFDVLDGLTRPFKEIPPKHFYDTEGSRLFEQIIEPARVLPDAHRALDPRGQRARAGRGDPGRGAGRARQRRADQDAAAAGRDARRRDAGPLRAVRRLRGRAARERQDARRALPGHPRLRRRRRLRAPPRRAARRPRARA